MRFAPPADRKRAYCLYAPLLAVLVLSWAVVALATGTLTITVINVGQGDATLIESPSGKTLLFDGGKSGRGTDIILPLLATKGISTLDYTVASHYHADHIGGMDEVALGLSVGVAYDRGWDYTSNTYNNYASAVAAVRQTLEPGQVIDLGEEVTVTCVALNSAGVLPYPYDNDGFENEYDISLLVQYGGFDYFQAGDLTGGGGGTRDVESPVADLTGNIDVYHVNHHGSITSSNDYFLQTTQAEVGVISVGEGNSYGHPTQTVLDRLSAHGLFVYQTEAGSGGTLPPDELSVVDDHVVITTDGITHYFVAGDQWALDETGWSPVDEFMPVAFRLLGNAPNPFNPSTMIRFVTAEAGPSRLTIYDVAGRAVFTESILANAGLNAVRWYGRENGGIPVAAGVYLYTVSTPAGGGTGRMLLLK